MAKEFEKGPGDFPEGPLVNLGAAFGQPATEVKSDPKTVTIYRTGGLKEEVPVENIVSGGDVTVTKIDP